jgi:hypothetical protein
LGQAASGIFANFHQVLEKVAQVYFTFSSGLFCNFLICMRSSTGCQRITR